MNITTIGFKWYHFIIIGLGFFGVSKEWAILKLCPLWGIKTKPMGKNSLPESFENLSHPFIRHFGNVFSKCLPYTYMFK